MKKTIQLIYIAILFLPFTLLRQPVFYGFTEAGGQGVGSIIKFESGTSTLSSVFNFPNPPSNPINAMVLANNGKYYGVTNAGGTSGVGIIYSYDVSSNTKTELFNFNITKGAAPYGSLFKASNGKLYGMTVEGGSKNAGVIYSFNTTTNAQTKLLDFDSVNGANPYSSFMQATNGKLYGTTFTGGAYNLGTLFSFDPVTNTQVKLYDFDSIHGASPYGGLVQAGNGKLYGVTAGGGTINYGTLFSFDLSGNTLVKLVDFNFANGAYPSSSLIKATNGKLYGVTQYGGDYSGSNGTLFSFDPATNIHIKLFDFNNAFQNSADPAGPIGSLVQATNGKLYGMTYSGGSAPHDGGTLFSFDLSTNTPAFYFVFGVAYGSNPYGSLVQDANGKFYGVTPYGGSQYRGTIFSFDPVANTHTKLIDFTTNNGLGPIGSPVLAGNGKYYGMTQYGGNTNNGTIFSYDPATNTETKVFEFDGTNGDLPFASLMKSSNGKLYGLTYLGGNNAGTLFSFDPATNTHVKLRDLGGPEGGSPTGGLVEASNGKLYAMTKTGGSPTFPVGTIFAYDTVTNIPVKVFSFDSATGYVPYGSLIQAGNGKLYGMTFEGGSKDSGTAFSFDPATSTFAKLLDFGAPYGTEAAANFVQASNGILYGMTVGGGLNDLGTIFSIDPATNAIAKLHDFDGTNGSRPFGNLVQASNGKLYGTTWDGGSKNMGVVFSYDITNAAYTKLQDFIGTNGANPRYDINLVEQNPCPVIPPTITASGPLKICNAGSVTLSTNKIGNAISLSNTGSKYISVPHSASVNISAGATFTIEAWINVTDNVNNTIIDKGDYDFLFQAHPNGNTGLGFYNRNFGWIYSTGTIPLNQWVHVAVTYNTQTVKFYQNGVLQGTYTSPAVTLGDTGPINIGRQQPALCGCNVLDGSIDELRLWNVTRTQAQIQASMNVSVPTNSTGLKAYYKFDDNAGAITKDATANANNGTLINAPTWQVPSTSPVGYSNYLWSNGATTSSITVSTSATYTVTVTNANGCTGSATAIVTKSTSPTVTVTPTAATVCTPSTNVVLTAGGTAASFTWSPGASLNQTTGSSVTANPSVTTTYIVTGYSAAGCTASKSIKVTVNPKPVNPFTTNITSSGSTTNWDIISCASGYTLQYKKSSVTTWTTVQINTNSNSKILTGLLPATTYNWRVKTKFSNGALSGYTTPVNFITLALREGELAANDNFNLYPNPSTGSFTIQFTGCENCAYEINVYDVLGHKVFTEKSKAEGNSKTVDLSHLAKGIYQVQVLYNALTNNCKLVMQ